MDLIDLIIDTTSGYSNFKKNWINNECKNKDLHFTIPNTYKCSLCSKKATKINKDGGYSFKS